MFTALSSEQGQAESRLMFVKTRDAQRVSDVPHSAGFDSSLTAKCLSLYLSTGALFSCRWAAQHLRGSGGISHGRPICEEGGGTLQAWRFEPGAESWSAVCSVDLARY
ncbi:unnamed protein product [Symbiodinium microadriaticum]|nr:unnamed protein product [Symbiodinium sp. KB8]CAE7398780.1 unnamed protein product [Symbiodinium microadriaticum]